MDNDDEKTLLPVSREGFAALCEGLLPADKGDVAVAVSGGPDSMALCFLLSQLQSGRVHVITVDHGLRPEAAEEAQKVGAIVSGFSGVEHTVLVREHDGHDSRIMEKARHDRYHMMAEYCRAHKITHLFVAHHQDDQAETFLFRLAKGSGLDGLAGMKRSQPYDDDLMICRPFLTIPKARLIETCKVNDIGFVEDPSNQNDEFMRPRLRKSREVLEQEGLTAKRLETTAARILRAREALEFYADQLSESEKTNKDTGSIVFNFSALQNAPTETRLRVISKSIAMLADVSGKTDHYGPRMEKIEALEGRIFGGESFSGATLGGVKLSVDEKKGTLVLEKEKTAKK